MGRHSLLGSLAWFVGSTCELLGLAAWFAGMTRAVCWTYLWGLRGLLAPAVFALVECLLRWLDLCSLLVSYVGFDGQLRGLLASALWVAGGLVTGRRL